MKKYIGLDQYNQSTLSKIYESNDIAGIIAGDLLCNRAMFKFGQVEMNSVIADVVKNKKEVIYQTPLYVTERNIEDVHDSIMLFCEYYGVNKFIVQDIGVLNWLRKYNDDIEIIWGRMGRNRNQVSNMRFVNFVKKLGVNSMEIENYMRMEIIREHNINIYAIWGNLSYGTVSRECYHRYLLGNRGCDCGRACKKCSLQLSNDQIEMSVDGYFLGRKLNYASKELFLKNANTYADCIIEYVDSKNPIFEKELACC